jgi:hypothetical protein
MRRVQWTQPAHVPYTQGMAIRDGGCVGIVSHALAQVWHIESGLTQIMHFLQIYSTAYRNYSASLARGNPLFLCALSFW